MNRKLLVTLLQKNIQELELITQGFMEMTEYPMPIILLAQRKTEDIQLYIKELSILKDDEVVSPEIESVHLEQKIEVVEDILTMEIEEVSEIEEEVETISSEFTVEDIILDLPQSLAEVADIEEVIIDEELIIVEGEASALDETQLPTPTINEETRRTILGERAILTTHTRNELMAKADNSISSTLANKKITDIKQAISIGDRFRFQRELFRSNGEDMNKTLNYINQLATLEEVLSFLKSKYGWVDENEAADDFYQILKRRFV
jgi:hypothetical protein